MFAYFVVSLYGMAFVYCIVMVLWMGSVVSLLYEAIYSSVSYARFESSKPVGTSKVNGSHTVNKLRCTCM